MKAFLARCHDERNGPLVVHVLTQIERNGALIWVDRNDCDHELSPSFSTAHEALTYALEQYRDCPQLVSIIADLPEGFLGKVSSDLSSFEFADEPDSAVLHYASLMSGKYASLAKGRTYYEGGIFSYNAWKLILTSDPLPPQTSFNGLFELYESCWEVTRCIKQTLEAFIEVPNSESIGALESTS